ncbi:MAG: aminotransferase class III-fold pyridoxal phosphate-dependent enzyme, partial [Burkholderiales bacterium]|nr:aminotransferase class III-fold pyridoxal phosphate-dependent enzyme [Burkholderiales bacterium]
MQQDTPTTNAALFARRQAAIPRGVGHSHQIFIERGENAEVWDVEGRRYIDFAGGIAVLNTGHRHPAIIQAVKDQLDRYTHTCFQVLAYEPYVELAERLNAKAPGDFAKKTLFLTTGAEAVENAIKIARASTGRSGIICFGGGYHGRTLLTLAMTGKVAPYKAGFGPFPAEVFHATFPNALRGVTVDDAIASIESIFKNDIEASRVAAIILEPVQGEGGFNVAPPELFKRLRALCDQHGILLIADEVQTGAGRTGTWFAVEQSGVAPDLITLAKSMA